MSRTRKVAAHEVNHAQAIEHDEDGARRPPRLGFIAGTGGPVEAVVGSSRETGQGETLEDRAQAVPGGDATQGGPAVPTRGRVRQVRRGSDGPR